MPPVADWYWPAMHNKQPTAPVAAPYLPTSHARQVPLEELAADAVAYMPFAHATQLETPKAVEYIPAEQLTHTVCLEALVKLPEPQSRQLLLAVAAVEVEYVPAEHSEHSRQPWLLQ